MPSLRNHGRCSTKNLGGRVRCEVKTHGFVPGIWPQNLPGWQSTPAPCGPSSPQPSTRRTRALQPLPGCPGCVGTFVGSPTYFRLGCACMAWRHGWWPCWATTLKVNAGDHEDIMGYTKLCIYMCVCVIQLLIVYYVYIYIRHMKFCIMFCEFHSTYTLMIYISASRRPSRVPNSRPATSKSFFKSKGRRQGRSCWSTKT